MDDGLHRLSAAHNHLKLNELTWFIATIDSPQLIWQSSFFRFWIWIINQKDIGNAAVNRTDVNSSNSNLVSLSTGRWRWWWNANCGSAVDWPWRHFRHRTWPWHQVTCSAIGQWCNTFITMLICILFNARFQKSRSWLNSMMKWIQFKIQFFIFATFLTRACYGKFELIHSSIKIRKKLITNWLKVEFSKFALPPELTGSLLKTAS